MKLTAKVLKDMSNKLISAEQNPWQFEAEFLNNFSGNKRTRKKKAKKFISKAINEVIRVFIEENK